MNITKNSITMRRWDDFHLHVREKDMLRIVLPYSAKYKYGLIMPNPRQGKDIITGENINQYRQEITSALPPQSTLKPQMTFKIIDDMTAEMVRDAKQAGAVAGKAYPIGTTTGASTGISNFRKLYHVFEEIQSLELVLCIHGENLSVPSLYREHAFLKTLRELAYDFPALRIVLEHVSTKEGVECVQSLPKNVAATIAVPHLFLTDDDIAGGKLHPHFFCKPRPKFEADRRALRNAAMSRSYKFFFGSDSAPHPRYEKECSEGEAGIFSAPVTRPLLVKLFDECGLLHTLEDFTSRYGREFYRFENHENDEIEIIRKRWQVPGIIGNFFDTTVVPLYANTEMQWHVVE